MRFSKTSLFVVTAFSLLGTACVRQPDVVTRKEVGFTKETSLTLMTEGSDPVNFIPELERELLRRGFNVISRDVASTETQTTIVAGDKAAGKVEVSNESNRNNSQAAAASSGSSNTATSIHTIFRSKFVGKINYSYDAGMTARHVNLTIIELSTGKIAASLGSDHGFDNAQTASNIADQLAKVIQ